MPGHIGVKGNEKADDLTRKGTSAPLVGPGPFYCLANALFEEELKRLIATRRGRLWRETEGQRQAKELLGGWNFIRFRACISGLSKSRLK